MGHVEINVARLSRTEETQLGNDDFIRSLIDENGCMVKGVHKISEAVYKHFAEFFG